MESFIVLEAKDGKEALKMGRNQFYLKRGYV